MHHEGGVVSIQAAFDEDRAYDMIMLAHQVALEVNDLVVLMTACSEIESILDYPGLTHMRADAEVIQAQMELAERIGRIIHARALARDPRWQFKSELRLRPRSEAA